jgi:hypothetical protein
MTDTPDVLDGSTPSDCPSRAHWGEWTNLADRYVAVTSINDGQSPITISSKFMGFDPSPRITGRPRPFVTTIFGGPLSGKSWRGMTRQATLLHHAAAVGQVVHALASKLDLDSASPQADEASRSELFPGPLKEVAAELVRSR